MDKIRKFDETLKQINSIAFLYSKICFYLLGGIGVLTAMIPFEPENDGWGMFLLGSFLCAWSVDFYLMPYLKVKNGHQDISVWKIIQYMPVTKNDYQKVRTEYLNRVCLRIGGIVFVLQEGMSLANHSFGLVSVMGAVLWMAVVWVIGKLAVLFG